MAKIYILLPVHNRKEITRNFIECLKAQTFEDFHLVLIDDGSADGTANMVLEYLPSATVLRGSGDWWWAGSLQQGLNWLSAHAIDPDALVLIINDDVSFAPDYLENAVRIMADKQGVLMLSNHKSPQSGDILESGITANLNRLSFDVAGSADQINCLSTRGLFIYWRDMRAIGGFHPLLLPHYLSDYEYTIRAHKKGYRCETSNAIPIEINCETTGYHVLGRDSFTGSLKKLFSKRSVSNPVYASSFVLLTSGMLWVVPNLARVWAGAIKIIINAGRHRK